MARSSHPHGLQHRQGARLPLPRQPQGQDTHLEAYNYKK